jgi:hypothetical protein
VRHGGETATYRGSKKGLSFVAFYSDCRHQVRPVTSGYRIVLTYNLLLGGERDGSAAEQDPELVDSLAQCVRKHFAPADGPQRLVYLLDHEYTHRGLGWSRLKGADARCATLFEAAAAAADCEVALALADVHETWAAYEPDEHWYAQSVYSRWDDRDEEFEEFDGVTEDYDLQELIESEVRLDGWIQAPGAQLEKVVLPISADEVCAGTPSTELAPYASEYEGYMGNWGNTLDRWYHRGAVVLWPRRRDFFVRAEASPSWALDQLSARARKGDLRGVRETAAGLASFWSQAATRVESKGLLTKALRAARLVDEPTLAAMLLRPFRLELLTPTHAKALSALLSSYGERWTEELVVSWSAHPRFPRDADAGPDSWMASLPRICLACRETGEAATSVARLLLRQSWAWINQNIEWGLDLPSPSHRARALAELGHPLAAILKAAALVGATDLREDALRVMCRDEELLGLTISVLRSTPASQWVDEGIDVVAVRCSAVLQTRLARPIRAADDWSIELTDGCSCELCGDLGAFLRDPARRRFEWPLAKERRAHVHRRIDAAELPVTHQTRRTGRPFTLVLTKTDALVKREMQRRRCDEEDLAWLKRNNIEHTT